VHAPVEGAVIVGELGDLEVHVAVQPVHRVVHSGELEAELLVAASERVHRGPDHLDADVAHLGDLLDDGGVAGKILGDRVDLRDVHGLVADPLEVQARVHDHRDEAEVCRHGSLQRKE
jgi:hypothetical protein